MGGLRDEREEHTEGSRGIGEFGFPVLRAARKFFPRESRPLFSQTTVELRAPENPGFAVNKNVDKELSRKSFKTYIAELRENWNNKQNHDSEDNVGENARHLEIFNGESRVEMTPELMQEYPARCVGKLRTPLGICTASMISRSLVLSNQHCLGVGEDGSLPDDFFDVSSLSILGFEAKFARVEWSGKTSDFSIWQLIDPIGETTGHLKIRWTSSESFSTPISLSYVGYSGDILKEKGVASGDFSCLSGSTYTEDEFTSVFHYCDTFLGASGSSMLEGLAFENGKFVSTNVQVVGVNWGESRSGNLMIPTNDFRLAYNQAVAWKEPLPGSTPAPEPADQDENDSSSTLIAGVIVTLGVFFIGAFLFYSHRKRHAHSTTERTSDADPQAHKSSWMARKKSSPPPVPPAPPQQNAVTNSPPPLAPRVEVSPDGSKTSLLLPQKLMSRKKSSNGAESEKPTVQTKMKDKKSSLASQSLDDVELSLDAQIEAEQTFVMETRKSSSKTKPRRKKSSLASSQSKDDAVDQMPVQLRKSIKTHSTRKKSSLTSLHLSTDMALDSDNDDAHDLASHLSSDSSEKKKSGTGRKKSSILSLGSSKGEQQTLPEL